MAMRRNKDAEGELNLPPGFRFHPTDEELVVHYLCRKVAKQCLPVPIIAEVDLYKYEPWELPDKALFGEREWYFFTPRDRKYPNGSRPNRSAGGGYWKATGADKPISSSKPQPQPQPISSSSSSSRPLGIKKALVFYHGKAPKGVKTDWIMHEYRLASPNSNRTPNHKGTLRLDEWVLCRLYNKKNAWDKNKKVKQQEEEDSDSFRTLESDVEFPDSDEPMQLTQGYSTQASNIGGGVDHFGPMRSIKEDNDWFQDLNLDDLQNSPWASFQTAPGIDLSNPDCFFFNLGSTEPSPRLSKPNKQQPLF